MSTDPKNGSPEDLQEVDKYVKSQIKVGISLLVCTIVAVSATFMPFGPSKLRIAVVVCAALVNAFLVAGVSMHLKTEKKTITQFLVFTVVFTVVLFALTALAYFDSTGHH